MKTLESENNWAGLHNVCWTNCAAMSPNSNIAVFEKAILPVLGRRTVDVFCQENLG